MATSTPGQVLNGLPSGVFKTLNKVKPMGALQARKQASGVIALYWRYSIGSLSQRVSIGLYDSSAAPKSLTPTKSGYSLAAATRAAESLSLEHHMHRNEGGRPALVAAKRDAKDAAEEAKQRASVNTLKALLTAYCDHMEAVGRRSHKDARSIFNLHVIDAWPKIAAMPAKSVTVEHVADMMRKLIDAGKGRTANKLRSYARAAYQTAKSAKSKASVPVIFKAFEITTNPAADTEPDESQNRPDKRPMDAEELRNYWRVVKPLEGFRGALLRLHLLTGGQRIEQLVNLQTANIQANSILLHDGKGRPGQAPRPHSVPLTREAAKALASCKAVGVFALSTDGGKTHVASTTLSDWATGVAPDTITAFQTKRIRSGVETLLASAGVSREVRGRLQSHGISGVQARHYDGYEYLDEKRSALKILFKLLEQRAAPSSTQRKRKINSLHRSAVKQ